VDLPDDGTGSIIHGRDGNVDATEDNSAVTPHGNGDPPPAFATTSTETIDFSIGFGFAALIYVSL
jgi:hypothetical protein